MRLQAIADMKPQELTTSGSLTGASVESSSAAAQGINKSSSSLNDFHAVNIQDSLGFIRREF